MYKVIQPVDGKEVRITNIKSIYHEVPGLPKGNSTRCLEYTVIGNHHQWSNYSIYDDFVEANPGINIGEIINNGN